jgi:UDP-glucose 4-epimerase
VKIAVTGGAGFLGRYVIEYAEAAGHEVQPFDTVTDDVDIRRDVTDMASVGEGLDGADHVIHLAGVLGTHELFDTPQMAIDVNVTGTLNVLEWCHANGAGYTGIMMPDVFPSIYTATKVAAARLATAYHHTHHVPVSHVRAFNAHGPGQAHGPGHPQKILPTFATQAWRGEPIPIWGDGSQTVDLVTAFDLGRMLVDATRFGDDDVFDGGTGQALTVFDVATFVSNYAYNAMGKGERWSTVEYLPMRRGEIPTHIVASGEGWERLGWRPKFRWEDVSSTVDSYRPEAS